jgi:transcriptional regulator with XRE-family HTH domain
VSEETPSTSARPPDVGAELQRARERRGESLVQASDRTRISVRYLEALERDAPLSEFPSPTYARFFLREYARYLGLDEARVLRAFALATGDGTAPTEELEVTRLPRARRQERPQRSEEDRGEGLARLRALARALEVPPAPGRGRGPGLGRGRSWGTTVVVRLLAAATLAAGAVGGMFFAVERVRDGQGARPGVQRETPGAGGTPQELPGGGTTLFPRYRVVAFYGTPGTTGLGILGVGPERAAQRLLRQAAAYRTPHRQVLPAFELVATVARGEPGEDGLYRERQPAEQIRRYLEAIRRRGGLLILDIQPGRSDFLTEVRVYEEFLREPDVGLALDPEWHVGPTEVPGRDLGSVDATTVNRVVRYLAGLVRRHELAQKLLVIHQFTEDMIGNRARIRRPPEVAVVIDVDGFGDPTTKVVKYQSFVTEDDGFHHGIKLYYERDLGLMSPQDVLLLQPEPDLVVYQ